MNSPEEFQSEQFARIKSRVIGIKNDLSRPEPDVSGRLVRLSGLRLEVSGLRARIGSRCSIETDHSDGVVAEVVGFQSDLLVLMCEGAATGLTPGARVRVLDDGDSVIVDENFSVGSLMVPVDRWMGCRPLRGNRFLCGET